MLVIRKQEKLKLGKILTYNPLAYKQWAAVRTNLSLIKLPPHFHSWLPIVPYPTRALNSMPKHPKYNCVKTLWITYHMTEFSSSGFSSSNNSWHCLRFPRTYLCFLNGIGYQYRCEFLPVSEFFILLTSYKNNFFTTFNIFFINVLPSLHFSPTGFGVLVCGQHTTTTVPWKPQFCGYIPCLISVMAAGQFDRILQTPLTPFFWWKHNSPSSKIKLRLIIGKCLYFMQMIYLKVNNDQDKIWVCAPKNI